MAELLCRGVLHRETEFVVVSPGVRVFGACGPNSLGDVASNARGEVIHTSAVYWLMRNAGLCDGDGVTTLWGIEQAAQRMGLKIAASFGYRNPPWNDWQAAFNTHAGINPFVAQVCYGQTLIDVISGDGENANDLHSHFICVLGRNTGGWSPRANRNLPPGYWVADGCSFAGGNNNQNGFNAADVLQFYTDDMMNRAQPAGMLAIEGVSQQMAWHSNSDGTAHDDASPQHTAGRGLAALILGSDQAQYDGLASERYSPDQRWSVVPLESGEVAFWNTVTQRASFNGAIPVVSLFADVDSLTAQVKQLQQALAQAQQQHPAPEPPAPLPERLTLRVNGTGATYDFPVNIELLKGA